LYHILASKKVQVVKPKCGQEQEFSHICTAPYTRNGHLSSSGVWGPHVPAGSPIFVAGPILMATKDNRISFLGRCG